MQKSSKIFIRGITEQINYAFLEIESLCSFGYVKLYFLSNINLEDFLKLINCGLDSCGLCGT